MPEGARHSFGASLDAAIGGRRWVVAILVFSAAWTGFLGLGNGLLLISAIEARQWPQAEAEITRVTQAEGRRTARYFDLGLVLQLPDGQRVEGETIALYRPRGGWSNPEPNPRIGDSIQVLVDPDDPRRMRPVSAWPPLWETALGAIVFSAAHLGLWTVLIALWRARRSPRQSPPPTGG